jgi:hypothetical protein
LERAEGLIMSEPDYLPKEEAAIRMKMYSKLLYREMKDRVVALSRNGDEPGLVNRPSRSL